MPRLKTSEDVLKEVFDFIDTHETGVASRVDLRGRVDKFVHMGGQENLSVLSSQVAALDDIVVERSEFEELTQAWAASAK